ncbi:hypothetical protein [Jutongia huaianensis]|uniref:Fibronectin type-III domain-containing protein n=1 Tax=Jutongia huaianensis TaxID=2763668 RepID=A0ABR7N4L7_9FIRM|nr:hypothetical protein [Jutongia huaianensis]MBC8563564.1 hypothetical protein [Jutongia huaianensis]
MNIHHLRNKSRTITMIMCITLIFSLFPFPQRTIYSVQAATPSYDGILELNKPVTIFLSYDLQHGSREATYQFTPAESCDYTFYSISNEATACYLRSSNGTMLDYDYTHHGSRGNFSLTCSLSAGSTYYFTAQFSETSSTEGSFDICLRKTIDKSSYEDTASVSLSPSGIAESISTMEQSLFVTFTPAVTGKYAIYQLPSCNCPDQKVHQENCTYLQDLCITVSQKSDNNESALETVYYSTSSDKENGFLIYDVFQANTTYYFEISCITGNKTGDFKLGISEKLSDAPIESWSIDGERELTLENSYESLFFQTAIATSITLSSPDSTYVYAELLDSTGKVLSQSTFGDLRLNYTDTIASGNYYIRIYTSENLTQSFHLSKLCPATPAPTVSPSSSPVTSIPPQDTKSPEASSTASVTSVPDVSAPPVYTPSVSKDPDSSNAPTINPSVSMTPDIPHESLTPGISSPTPDVSAVPVQSPSVSETPTGQPSVSEQPFESTEPSLMPSPFISEAPNTVSPSPESPISSQSPSAAPITTATNLRTALEQTTTLSSDKVIISKIKKQAYTGKAIKPSFTVTLNDKLLTVDQDYTVKYKNNKKIGTARAIISGISSYTGQLEITFDIVPAAPKFLKYSNNGKQLSLSWKKVKKVTGYEVQYSYQKNFKKKIKKTTKKTTFSAVVKSNKKIYVRVRTFATVKNKKYYSNYIYNK